MTWDEDTDTLSTEYGEYQVEWNTEVMGYEAVLYDENDVIWHSEAVPSDPKKDDGTQFCDTKAVMKCREYAMDHYARRKP
jgi:hypothetical protein